MQIIESQAFEGSVFAEQVNRLKNAANQISQGGLADTILNSFQVAAGEDLLREHERPPGRIRSNINEFLLDITVRERLKEKGGPIDRIARFLSDGRTGAPRGQLPTFESSDFDFSMAFVERTKREQDGYRRAKNLVESLYLKPELREQLATYLNRLLTFAISNATSLSADELKEMFYDLRRELRRQGRSLALFVEDIAVFSGLDAGLVDVLATQHTGEGNRELCRMLSVVGITDAYYRDRFPDNIKQRVTHHLTLNKPASGTRESHLLSSEDAVVDLAARYLNAMRLDQTTLDEWLREGARPEAMPVRCIECLYTSTCHAAFDSVDIGDPEDGHPRSIGLYPFNARALKSMYAAIDTTKTSRTPRTLLTSVLEYVLQSHGEKVSQGQFPPEAHALGNDFEPPMLANPAQLRLIDHQARAPAQAKRVESLIRFWGNRTIDVTLDTNGEKLVGGLRREVFEAFGLPFISGEEQSPPPLQPNTPPPIQEPERPAQPPERRPQPINLGPVSRPKPETNLLTRDIDRWRAHENLLENYDIFAKLLANLAEDFIDWQAYGVPSALIEERLKQARFAIEDQAGRVVSTHHLYLKRSDELVELLYVLADLDKNGSNLTQKKWGSHLVTLSSWFRKHEERIVEFVRQPVMGVSTSMDVAELLPPVNSLIAYLDNRLDPKDEAPENLYLKLVEMSVQAPNRAWEASVEASRGTRTQIWSRAMLGVARYVDVCRDMLFPTYNLEQGRSTTLRFIDAARMLRSIENWKAQDWILEELEFEVEGDLWRNTTEAYRSLRKSFLDTIDQEKRQIYSYRVHLEELIGEDSPTGVIEAMSDLLEALRRQQISYRFHEDPEVDVTMLDRCLSELSTLPKGSQTVPLALWLSNASQLIKETQRCLEYLDEFADLMEQKERWVSSKITRLSQQEEAKLSDQDVEQTYADVRALLAGILERSGGEDSTQ
jgi:hypothetical protein